MKSTLCAAIVGITALLITPTIASAQRNPQRIPWDVIISRGDQRFVVLRDFNFEAVLDQETSLVWEKEPSPDRMSWQEAQVHCTRLVKGGRGGWRLPTIQELTSLTVVPPPPAPPSGSEDPLPAGHPFVLVPNESGGLADYWSATSSETTRADRPTATGFAWTFGGRDGAIFVEDKAGGRNPDGSFQDERPWCVRFRQGVNPQ